MYGWVCAHERVYHNEKKVPDKIATKTNDTSDTSRNQQQAQCKGKFNMKKRLFFSVNHCHPYRKKERSSLLNLYTCFSLPVSGPRLESTLRMTVGSRCVCVCVCMCVRVCVCVCVCVLK